MRMNLMCKLQIVRHYTMQQYRTNVSFLWRGIEQLSVCFQPLYESVRTSLSTTRHVKKCTIIVLKTINYKQYNIIGTIKTIINRGIIQ